MFDIEDWDINIMKDTGLTGDFLYGSYVDWDRFRRIIGSNCLRLLVHTYPLVK